MLVSHFVAFSWKETIGVGLVSVILREAELAPRHHHSLAICPTGRLWDQFVALREISALLWTSDLL